MTKLLLKSSHHCCSRDRVNKKVWRIVQIRAASILWAELGILWSEVARLVAQLRLSSSSFSAPKVTTLSALTKPQAIPSCTINTPVVVKCTWIAAQKRKSSHHNNTFAAVYSTKSAVFNAVDIRISAVMLHSQAVFAARIICHREDIIFVGHRLALGPQRPWLVKKMMSMVRYQSMNRVANNRHQNEKWHLPLNRHRLWRPRIRWSEQIWTLLNRKENWRRTNARLRREW